MEQQHALFPTYARYPIALVKGEGSWLWDDQGNRYLDFMSGLAVTNLGHAHPAVKEKLQQQLDELWHVSNLFHIPNQEKLAKRLTEISCADAVFFCNSGAEANEAAIKLARRYNHQVLKKDRYEVITFQQSFHGRTLATLTATGQDKVKEGFHPLPEGFVYSPYNDAAALQNVITDKTCAIMLEMVQGEGGVNPADPQFVKEIVRLCEAHDLLLIVDEIQTGMGRTGKMFAFEHYGLEPDIFTLAKGLGNGFPIGAMLGKAKLKEAFGAGSHGTTFGGTPIAAATGLAVVETITGQNLPQRAAEMGELLKQKLSTALSGHPQFVEIRGKGLMVGIEFSEPVGEYIAKAQQKGLLAVQAGPNVLRLLPNLLVTEEEIDQAVNTIHNVVFDTASVSSSS
ncbi:acetylornithine transaminase [Marinicrinis lubricantis]|uniref:Acetylornithine aminotransferase n=1 Tax=Marinicrinis lubricantis TaxID=2086470 RepID=A0ABW1ITY7_9BACL